ncbi:MAG: sigma-54 dependent transcriptional regulator [Parasphingorhabdus sp.]
MKNPNILLVEDDPSVAQVIYAALDAEGVTVDSCSSIEERNQRLSLNEYDLLITDVGLGEADGIETLDAVKAINPDMPIIVISARNTLDTAVRASETGAFEYFPKPFDLDELIEVVQQAINQKTDRGTMLDFDDDDMPLVGRSTPMQNVYRMITRLLNNDLSVLVMGESGTGKELVAEAIHQLGHRKSGPFVAVNMAAIPAELIEAELFGHEKGAFTGAIAAAAGKFEQAHGGTLFLDEIGDMPMHAQTRLLRALQSGEISRVGGKDLVKLDVRIVTATNKDFLQLIEEGKFREDLYYRINVVPVELPPLRDRIDDIPALLTHFLKMAAREGLPQKQFSDQAITVLQHHQWRGNVRELKNLVYRISVTAREEVISDKAVSDLLMTEGAQGRERPTQDSFSDGVEKLVGALTKQEDSEGRVYGLALEQFERPMLETILKHVQGNQIKAASTLGINRNTLRKKLTEYGIDPSLIR